LEKETSPLSQLAPSAVSLARSMAQLPQTDVKDPIAMGRDSFLKPT
jgi:hypothetical protein